MNLETFFLYMLGMLDPAEAQTTGQTLQDPVMKQQFARLTQTWRHLNITQRRRQAAELLQTELDLEQKLARIARWVAGDATADEIEAAETDIAADEGCRDFHADLVRLKANLERHTPPTMMEAEALVRSEREPLQFRPMFTRPALGWRDEAEKPSDIVLDLPVEDEFGFSLSLQMQPASQAKREIHGEISLPSGFVPDDIVGARVWLMPAEQRAKGGWVTWQEEAVSEIGTFKFTNVMAGPYILEMAWPQHFMESDRIEVPAS